LTTTSRARRLRHLALAVTILLAAPACGSRVDVDAASDQELDGDTPAAAAPEADAAEVGSIANPCSDDAPEGSPSADVPGVTDDSIRIGVISDRENPAVPLPTVGIEEAVKAFVEYCNEAGGINGRTLELKTYDSKIAETEAATTAACRDDLFALVGTGSVQDQQGVTTRVECGLPEIGAYSATSTRSESEDFFQPVVGTRSTFFNVGPCKWIAEKFPDAVKKAAIVYTDLPAASVRAAQIRDNCEAEAGFEFVVDEGTSFGTTDWSTVAAQMKARGVRYFTMVSEAAGTISLMEEMDKQGVELEVIDLGQQYYTKDVGDAAVADGAYVLTNTVPFSEIDESPALQLYRDYVEETGAGEDKITTLGVQAFSAGLLFATAADALGAALTREGLVTELEGINEWDGGGLQMVTNPGDDVHNECFLYMRIVEGEFVREYPDEGFQCDPANVIESDKAYEN
jgi:ABC-type branched-subunit amino acid transport system substrate-binding protein